MLRNDHGIGIRTLTLRVRALSRHGVAAYVRRGIGMNALTVCW
jgi:hypothetical protein